MVEEGAGSGVGDKSENVKVIVNKVGDRKMGKVIAVFLVQD